MKERKGFIRWIKEHKKELIIAGIGIGTLVTIILGIKDRETIIALWDSLRKVMNNSSEKVAETATKATVEVHQEPVNEVLSTVTSNVNTLPFEVSQHIRNLPDGWHASAEKIADALKNNIILLEGQTWVDDYMKRGAAV